MRSLQGGPEVGMKVRSGAELIRLKLERGVSWAEVGRSAGVSGQFVGMLARGERTCSAAVALKIAETLGGPEFDPDVLFRACLRRTASATPMPATSGRPGISSGRTAKAVA